MTKISTKNNDYQKVAFSGAFWMFFERWGLQGVTLLVSIVLARILEPEAYGTVALVTTLNSLLSVFIDSGMGNALVQKKDADDLDYSSLFFFNMAICIVLYLGMFFSAPFIAKFYDNNQLVSVVRVSSITLIVSGLINVQQSYALKHFKYRNFFFSTLGATVGSAVIGILCAVLGFGVWALVIQSLFNCITRTIVLWFTVKWKPKLMFSLSRLKGLFNFGWKLLATNLIDKIYVEIRQLIIAKLYTTKDLAYYNKAHGWPNLLMTNVVGVIDRVLFPIMAEEQDDKKRVANILSRSIKTSTYIMTPMLVGLAACAEPFVSVILTDKWLPSVPYTRIFCLGYILYSMCNANLNAFKALGRTDLMLKTSTISKILGILLVASSMWFGVGAMVYSFAAWLIITAFINALPSRKLLSYDFFKQLKDIFPTLALSAFMGVVVYSIQFIKLNNLLTLVLQVLTGMLIYIAGSVLFKFETFGYIWAFVKNKIKK